MTDNTPIIPDKPKHAGGRPLKFESKEMLQEQIADYFTHCDNTIIKTTYNRDGEISSTISTPYTVSGLASHLDTDRKTINNYNQIQHEFFPIIQKARQKIESALESKTLTGEYSPAMAIFSLKNNSGWVDKQEIAHTGADGKPLTIIVSRGADRPQIEEHVPDAELIEE